MYGRSSSRSHLTGTSSYNNNAVAPSSSSGKSASKSSSIRALSYLFPITGLWTSKYSKTTDDQHYSGKNISAKQDPVGNMTYYLTEGQRQKMRQTTIAVKPNPNNNLSAGSGANNNIRVKSSLANDDHYTSNTTTTAAAYDGLQKMKSNQNMRSSSNLHTTTSSTLSNSGANTLSNKKKINPIGGGGYSNSNSSLDRGESFTSPTKYSTPKSPPLSTTKDRSFIGSSSSIAPMTSLSAPPTPAVASSSSSSANTNLAGGGAPKKLCCDKCDGNHETDNCPYFKKKREDHPDAQRRSNKQMGSVSNLPGAHFASHEARVIRQPGDGSCLFHSMSYGLGHGNASRLRSEVCNFISNNPTLLISETPLKDWVKWDSGGSVGDYVKKMSRGSWGGGIEMACVSQMKQVNVHVYERVGSGYKRISAFDYLPDPKSKPIVRVLYCGGVHYDALVV